MRRVFSTTNNRIQGKHMQHLRGHLPPALQLHPLGSLLGAIERLHHTEQGKSQSHCSNSDPSAPEFFAYSHSLHIPYWLTGTNTFFPLVGALGCFCLELPPENSLAKMLYGCELGKILNHVGDISLSMSVKVFLDRLIWRRPHPECWQHHSISWSEWKRESELRATIRSHKYSTTDTMRSATVFPLHEEL